MKCLFRPKFSASNRSKSAIVLPSSSWIHSRRRPVRERPRIAAFWAKRFMSSSSKRALKTFICITIALPSGMSISESFMPKRIATAGRWLWAGHCPAWPGNCGFHEAQSRRSPDRGKSAPPLSWAHEILAPLGPPRPRLGDGPRLRRPECRLRAPGGPRRSLKPSDRPPRMIPNYLRLVLGQRFERPEQPRISRVARGDAGVPEQADELAPGDGSSLESLTEAVRRQLQQVPEAEAGDLLPRGEEAPAPGAGEAVPGADVEADVAAEDPQADPRAQFLGDVAAILDRLIGNAAPGVHYAGRREGLGGTCFQ